MFIPAGSTHIQSVQLPKAGDVMATDPVVFSHLSAALGETFARQVEFAAAGAGALLAIGVGGLWRQLSLSKAHAVSPAGEAGGS